MVKGGGGAGERHDGERGWWRKVRSPLRMDVTLQSPFIWATAPRRQACLQTEAAGRKRRSVSVSNKRETISAIDE